MSPAVSWRADWSDILVRLPLLSHPDVTILEVDRVTSAIPGHWARAGIKTYTVCPLSYALQFDERDLTLNQQDGRASRAWYVADADTIVECRRDPLASTAAAPPAFFRGRTVDTIASSVRNVGMIVFGLGADHATVRSATATIASRQPVLLFRLGEASPPARDLLASVRNLHSYEALTAEELGLTDTNGPWTEEIMILVPSHYEKGALRSLGRAPQSLTETFKSNSNQRPFRMPNASCGPWSSEWIVPVNHLITRGFDTIESFDGVSWRWSRTVATAIYAEVPAPGRYRISINIPFYVNESTRIQRLVVNGRNCRFASYPNRLDFETEIFRHVLIDIQCPTAYPQSADDRLLGFAVSGLTIINKEVIGLHGLD